MEDTTLTKKIEWYVLHRYEILSYRDNFLANVDVSNLNQMHGDTKQEWLFHLKIARKTHAIELRLQASGQNAITSYLVPHPTEDRND